MIEIKPRVANDDWADVFRSIREDLHKCPDGVADQEIGIHWPISGLIKYRNLDDALAAVDHWETTFRECAKAGKPVFLPSPPLLMPNRTIVLVNVGQQK